MSYKKDKKEKEEENGYNSVIKEFDIYNNTDDEFEIIDAFPNDFYNKNNDNNDSFEDLGPISKLQSYILYYFKIIFNSRNKNSKLMTKSKEKLKDNPIPKDGKELIEYESVTSSNNSKNTYFIDFYLIKNENEQRKNYLNNEKINDKKKLLVERWKIKYKDKENKNNINNFEEYLNKKMKIIEKSIVTYSRILPLFNILRNKKYLINCDFCPKKRKEFVDKKYTKKIKLINDKIFSFKLSIKYLEINPDNIDKFLNKKCFEFIIIQSKKSRKRLSSDPFNKKSSTQLLNGSDNNNENNNNIIENYFDDRRLSFQNNNDSKKYINFQLFGGNKEKDNANKIEINDSGSICSNEENLSLVISENENSKSKINHNDNKINEKTGKINDFNIFESTEDNFKKKSNEIEEIPKFKLIKSNEFSKLGIKNEVVNSILQDYKNVRRILNIIPDFDNVDNNKFSRYIFSK